MKPKEKTKKYLFRPFTYILLITLIWLSLFYLILVHFGGLESENLRLKHYNKMGRQIIEIQHNLILNRFDEALEELSILCNEKAISREDKERNLSSFWYSVGTCGFEPSFDLTASPGIRDEYLLNSLRTTFYYDYLTSHLIDIKTLIPVIDQVFTERKNKINAYVVLAEEMGYRDPAKSEYMLRQISTLSPSEFESLILSAKLTILLAKQDYEGIIALRQKEIPEIKANLSTDYQVFLVCEILAHVKVGDIQRAQEIGRHYLEIEAIKEPSLREAVNTLLEHVDKGDTWEEIVGAFRKSLKDYVQRYKDQR